jgi:hypothetical protein
MSKALAVLPTAVVLGAVVFAGLHFSEGRSLPPGPPGYFVFGNAIQVHQHTLLKYRDLS